MLSHLQRVKDQIFQLVERHGSEVSMCAKVAVSTLMPGGSQIADVIEVLCDYVTQEQAGAQDQKIQELLSTVQQDMDVVSAVLDHLLNKLDPLLDQLTLTQQTYDDQDDKLLELMEKQCNAQISTKETIAQAHRELLELQPSLTFVRSQNDEIIKTQVEQHEELKAIQRQIKDLMSVMMAHQESPDPKKLNRHQAREYFEQHRTFQRRCLAQDLEGMRTALDHLKGLDPYHPTVWLCEAVLSGITGDLTQLYELINEAPDAMRDGLFREMREALERELRTEDEPSYQLNDQGEVLLGQEEWRVVGEDEEDSIYVSNLNEGWLLSTQATDLRSQRWRVKSLHGDMGAICVLQGYLQRPGASYRQLKEEMTALQEIDHPSVIKVLDIGKTETQDPYVVTEPLEGMTLEDRLRRQYLSPDEMKRIGRQLVEGLELCHEAGVIHKNIHPRSIHIKPDGTAVLTEFGSAALSIDYDDEQRRVDDYASPEQKRGEPATTASDIYSLGRVLESSVGGLKRLPKAWGEGLRKMTAPIPSARISALQTQECLAEMTSRYYVYLPREKVKGPFEVSEIVELIDRGVTEFKVQRTGSLGSLPWQEVKEIASKICLDVKPKSNFTMPHGPACAKESEIKVAEEDLPVSETRKLPRLNHFEIDPSEDHDKIHEYIAKETEVIQRINSDIRPNGIYMSDLGKDKNNEQRHSYIVRVEGESVELFKQSSGNTFKSSIKISVSLVQTIIKNGGDHTFDRKFNKTSNNIYLNKSSVALLDSTAAVLVEVLLGELVSFDRFKFFRLYLVKDRRYETNLYDWSLCLDVNTTG